MSAPFYSTSERQASFLAEARSWLGTPFAENVAVKGSHGGVSCVHYIVAVQVACGAWPTLTLPAQPVEVVRAWHEHHSVSKILDFMARPEIRARLRKVDEDDRPLIGDIAVMQIDHSTHHLALYGGHELFHVTTRTGVISTSSRRGDAAAKIRSFYRIVGEPNAQPS